MTEECIKNNYRGSEMDSVCKALVVKFNDLWSVRGLQIVRREPISASGL